MVEKTASKQRGRGFKPGQSGNPSGRPKGALNRTTRAVQALLEGEAEALTRKAIEKALEGDSVALRLCLERIAPAPKDRPLAAHALELPPLTSENAEQSYKAIFRGAAGGRITPSEGQALMAMLDRYLRVAEGASAAQAVVPLAIHSVRHITPEEAAERLRQMGLPTHILEE